MVTITVDKEIIEGLDKLNVDYVEGFTLYKSTPLLELAGFGFGIMIGSGFGTFLVLYFTNLI